MKERQEQYQRKINLITEKLENLPEKPTGLLIDAVLHRLQISIEAATDLCAMLVKDLGETVGDDYHNLDLLAEKKVIPYELAEQLRSYTGLRNAIVHQYNKFEEREALQAVQTIRENLYRFLDCVENALHKIHR